MVLMIKALEVGVGGGDYSPKLSRSSEVHFVQAMSSEIDNSFSRT